MPALHGMKWLGGWFRSYVFISMSLDLRSMRLQNVFKQAVSHFHETALRIPALTFLGVDAALSHLTSWTLF